MSDATTGPGDNANTGLASRLERLEQQVTGLRRCLAEAVADPGWRASEFRRRRLDALARGTTPVPLRPGPALVLHVVPYAAFAAPSALLDLEKAEFRILGSGGNYVYNADGKLMWPGDQRAPAQRGYAQLSRTGWVEAAAVLRDSFLSPSTQGPDILYVTHVETRFMEGTLDYLTTLNNLKVIGPVQVAATLVGMAGCTLTANSFAFLEPLPIAFDEISLPVLTLEPAVADKDATSKALRPALDALWQAAGHVRCPHFDEAGSYRS